MTLAAGIVDLIGHISALQVVVAEVHSYDLGIRKVEPWERQMNSGLSPTFHDDEDLVFVYRRARSATCKLRESLYAFNFEILDWVDGAPKDCRQMRLPG